MIMFGTIQKYFANKYLNCFCLGLGFIIVLSSGNLMALDRIEGRWSARILRNRVKIRLSYREIEDRFDEWDWTQHFTKDAFTELEEDEDGSFRLIREAGTLDFKGPFTGKFVLWVLETSRCLKYENSRFMVLARSLFMRWKHWDTKIFPRLNL